MLTKNYLATSNLILSGTFNDHSMCALASLLCTQTPSCTSLCTHAHSQPCPWADTVHTLDQGKQWWGYDLSLSILIWASLSDSSLPWKEGQLEGRVSFSFGSGVLLWAGLEMRAFSLSLSPPPSLCGWQMDFGMDLWDWFLLGTLIIFYPLFILAHMATCLVIVFGSSLMRDVGDGGWGGCLLPVN